MATCSSDGYYHYETTCRSYSAPTCASVHSNGIDDGGTVSCGVGQGYRRKCKYQCGTDATCCLTGAHSGTGSVCHPNYINLNVDNCNTFMSAECAKAPTRLWNSADRCGQWCNAHPTECKVLKKNHCDKVGSLTDTNCKDWCAANNGLCETAAADYCSQPANKNVQFCACVNSPLRDLDTFDNGVPECFDQNCLKIGSYRTKSGSDIAGQGGGGCPDLLICNQKIDLAALGGIKIEGSIDQSCNIDSDGNGFTPPAGNPPPVDDPPDPPPDPPNELANPIVIIFIVVIFLIIIGVIIFVLLKKRNSEEYEEAEEAEETEETEETF